MTSSEMPHDERVPWHNDGSALGSEQMQNLFGLNQEATRQFISANHAVILIIQNNNLRMNFGITNITVPGQALEDDWMSGFIAENVLGDRLAGIKKRTLTGRVLRRIVGINSSKEGVGVWEALQVVQDSNKDILKEHPEAEAIKEKVDGLFDIVKRKTRKPLNPGIPVEETILKEWIRAFPYTIPF